MQQSGSYILFNSLTLYLYVGRFTPMQYIQWLFKCHDFSQIDAGISEEEIFSDYDQSPYLQTLYNIINQIRSQRQPFCALKVLLEGN